MGTNTSFIKLLSVATFATACVGSARPPEAGIAKAQPRDCAGRTVGSDAEVRTFAGCTRVLGDLTVTGAVTTLAPLATIGSVWGTLAIDSTERLRTLDGLHKLRSASDIVLNDNAQLTDIGALRGLRAAHSLSITDNPALEALNGLEGLRSLEGLTIASNGVYTLHGLGNVYSVGELVVSDNPRLYDPRGLAGIVEVQSIVLHNNPRLSGHFGILPKLRNSPAVGTIAGNSLCANETSRLTAAR